MPGMPPGDNAGGGQVVLRIGAAVAIREARPQSELCNMLVGLSTMAYCAVWPVSGRIVGGQEQTRVWLRRSV